MFTAFAPPYGSIIYLKSRSFLPALLFLLLLPAQHSNATTVCGNSDHWVDNCTAGTASLTVHMEFGLDMDLDGNTDSEAQLDGTMLVKWSNPIPSDPATAPGHNDTMGTQILSMQLTGSNAAAAGWLMTAGIDQGLAPSLGYILEEYSDPALAEIHYDMIFEISGTP